MPETSPVPRWKPFACDAEASGRQPSEEQGENAPSAVPVPRVLVIDDEPSVRTVVRGVLEEAGFVCDVASEGAEAIAQAGRHDYDVVVADLMLPDCTGLDVVHALHDRRRDARVIILTGAGDMASAIEAVRAHADDYIQKPFDCEALVASVRRSVKQRQALHELKMARMTLSRQVVELQQKLESRSMGGVMALANALEARDPYTKGHSARVADLSLRLAEALDYPPDQKEQIGVGALLHDVGKIAVPDAILLKKSPLTSEEHKAVRLHPRVGCDILLPLFGEGIVTDCALRHHERPDGRGYPEGLADDRCPQAGRIIAVADAYDAMTSERPYRRAFTAAAALSEIEGHRGTQFDAEIADLFCDLETRRNGRRDDRQEEYERWPAV